MVPETDETIARARSKPSDPKSDVNVATKCELSRVAAEMLERETPELKMIVAVPREMVVPETDATTPFSWVLMAYTTAMCVESSTVTCI